MKRKTKKRPAVGTRAREVSAKAKLLLRNLQYSAQAVGNGFSDQAIRWTDIDGRLLRPLARLNLVKVGLGDEPTVQVLAAGRKALKTGEWPR